MTDPAAPAPETPAPAAPAPEVIVVRTRRVACEGVGGALGHPRVYLEMGEAGAVECGYCDRRFVLGPLEAPESEFLAPGCLRGRVGALRLGTLGLLIGGRPSPAHFQWP